MSLSRLRKVMFGSRETEAETKYPRVEIIRKRLLAMDYEPEQDIERMRYAYETGTVANEHEGIFRTDEQIAFDDMMIEMRVPIGPLSLQMTKDYLSFVLEDHANVSGVFS